MYFQKIFNMIRWVIYNDFPQKKKILKCIIIFLKEKLKTFVQYKNIGRYVATCITMHNLYII